jgi:hypothetical protein
MIVRTVSEATLESAANHSSSVVSTVNSHECSRQDNKEYGVNNWRNLISNAPMNFVTAHGTIMTATTRVKSVEAGMMMKVVAAAKQQMRNSTLLCFTRQPQVSQLYGDNCVPT